jgi:DNA-binding IclR family transcriptional regulator
MGAEGGVAAVDRALSILEAFTDQDPELSLAELAKRTKMYKSTVLRLARSLEKYGHLVRDEHATYRLGSKLLRLGSLYQRHLRTADLVPDVLREIVAELNEGASFYVRDGDRRLCLHRVDAARSVQDSVREGDHLPLDVGAAGHVIRAFAATSGAKHEKVREAMYAASFGERDPEVAAVACPVFGLNQRLAGALAVSGPLYRIEALGVPPLLRVLLRSASQLTTAFGGDARDLDAALASLERAGKRVSRAR